MTVDDMLTRAAIQQTMARYTMAGDRLRIDDFLAVFTDDAVIEAAGLEAIDTFSYAGIDAIRLWLTSWRDRPEGAPPVHRATFVRHHLSTSDITLTGDRSAQARTYWVAYTDIGVDHAGYYADEFRRVGEEWLIAHRRIREDWRSPASLFAGAVANTR